jgi:DNA-binding PadR family transcriptional regulator
MDLQAAILGFLSWKPLSGYDLKKMLSRSDIFYWSGNNNQVYKSLLELQKEGLVTHQLQQQESLPAKKIYSLTQKGTAELVQHLKADPLAPELRKNFLIQLAWADILTDEEVMNLLEEYENVISDQLRLSQGQAISSANKPDRSARELFLWKRIHANLVDAYQTELEWVRETIHAFREKNYE